MKKAFTLVELLLVMMILGTIITLVITNQRILNYKRIYTGYQRKATEDVTNAANLVLYRNPSMKNFGKLIEGSNWKNVVSSPNFYSSDCSKTAKSAERCVRAFFKTVMKGKECDSPSACIGTSFHTCETAYKKDTGCPASSRFGGIPIGDTASSVGLKMKNGEVVMFQEAVSGHCDESTIPCFIVYVDMNGAKGPNLYGQDRYRYYVYKNDVVQNTTADVAYVNPNGLNEEEGKVLEDMQMLNTQCVAAADTASPQCKDFIQCFNKYSFAAKSQVYKCKCKCKSANTSFCVQAIDSSKCE